MEDGNTRTGSYLEKVMTAAEPFFTALRFLTQVPVSFRMERDSKHFHRALWFFPLVGLLIGCCAALLSMVLTAVFPQAVAAALLMVFMAFISGGLHLDGLADSGDGLLSARPREKALAIMKDSRSGAMGVIVLVMTLLVRFAALLSVDSAELACCVLVMPLAGRCAILLTMARLSYAREEGGLGKLFYTPQTRSAAAIDCLLACLLLFAVLSPGRALSVVVMILVTFWWFSGWCRRRLGGATGDTLGAVCELTETATALAFTIAFVS